MLRAGNATFDELQPGELSAYIYLTGTAEGAAEQIRPNRREREALLGSSREHIKTQVELSKYRIGKYPITNIEYQAFVREAGHKPPRHWDGAEYPEGKSDHPVVKVSWDDAVAYCRWLSGKSGKPYRLPTEAEWEKAARGASGLIYPWGNEWDEKKLNSAEAGPGTTTPVGQYSPDGDSPYGCADVAGNVWEWCADWLDESEYKRHKVSVRIASPTVLCVDWLDESEYKRQAGEVVKDPQGPEQGESRVLRGGVFNDARGSVRCAARNWDDPYSRSDDYGFRACASPI